MESPDARQQLRTFGPIGIAAIFVILAGAIGGPLVSSLLVLLWTWLSRTPWRDLGFVRPRNWATTIGIGIVLGIALKLAMKSVVMPLLGAPAMNAAYQFLAGNPAALPGMIATVLVSAAVGEEIFFRSYLMERVLALLGTSAIALISAVVVSATLFAAAHFPGQGWPGVQQAGIGGLAFASIFAWRREIWILMIAHAAFDLTATLLIYKGWETAVAHWLFA